MEIKSSVPVVYHERPGLSPARSPRQQFDIEQAVISGSESLTREDCVELVPEDHLDVFVMSGDVSGRTSQKCFYNTFFGTSLPAKGTVVDLWI